MRVIAALLSIAFAAPAFAGPADFHAPEPVTVSGYSDHLMEPFLSRDGRFLFFNNRNHPPELTDIHVALRVSDLKFRYLGRVPGANSPALDGVASVDVKGRFFLISPRDFRTTGNTLWQGQLTANGVVAITPVTSDLGPMRAPFFNMDTHISADGRTLYSSLSKMNLRVLSTGGPSVPAEADLVAGRRTNDGAFTGNGVTKRWFRNINTPALEYAPAVSADERTLYFTRISPTAGRPGTPESVGIWVATRPHRNAPFSPPQKIRAIKGFVGGAHSCSGRMRDLFPPADRRAISIDAGRKAELLRRLRSAFRKAVERALRFSKCLPAPNVRT